MSLNKTNKEEEEGGRGMQVLGVQATVVHRQAQKGEEEQNKTPLQSEMQSLDVAVSSSTFPNITRFPFNREAMGHPKNDGGGGTQGWLSMLCYLLCCLTLSTNCRWSLYFPLHLKFARGKG